MRKFGNRVTERDGYSFASRLEAAVYQELKLLERAGEIRDLKCQVTVYLSEAKIKMIPDFSYVKLGTGELVYVEAKGIETATYRLKRNLWKIYGPGTLIVYKGAWRCPIIREIIEPKREAHE